MFTQSAKYYDALYRAMGKDYAREAERVAALLAERGIARGAKLLDVACGTGLHLHALRSAFACEGLDADPNMLSIAAARSPDVPMHRSDLISFNLSTTYDALICLFSSVGYAPDVSRLNQAMRTFARHLRRGGVALVEPWITPDAWKAGSLHALFVDEDDLKIARMSVSRRDGNTSILNFHYMVGSQDGVRTFTEPHRMTLFTDEQYRSALRGAGFSVEHDAAGLTGRGLYIGRLE
ncbi:MAG: class I SAM-dependent methyltransferase [Vulcanimicrobiaceae bacterium]